ncbi:EF-P 5-aminopentanol modification-associated protein YfmF [Sporosalibacterium faouarense]|uniref:EF-P 5-aminopentanol modification-associated protein YfmF n=1 Tax=Sporosalibacterium faouarense TaxID=516123 RepID=UPI00141CF39F|nr:pitrilysin family protein [Sporosalibacterium faouarense]MTI49055.1 insulinase family protein [Bacillota bacterium]
MSIEYLREKIDNGVHFNLIKTNKFKTNLINFYIVRPLSKDEATKNALLPLILKRGTSKYNTSLEIQRRLEELYGANLSINVNKKGEKQIIRFAIETVNSDFIKEENLLRKILDMLNEIIFNPYTENEVFSQNYFKQEKENLKKRIEGRINDKKTYAVERCIEEMCKNEKFSIYKYGNIEDLEDISCKGLYEHYRSILRSSPMEISIVGNINKDEAINSIQDTFRLHREDIINLPREEVIKAIRTKNMITEEMDVNQGKLTLGLRTNIPYEDKLYEPLIVASNILGGGANSKLFLNVREKESLAYYIYSKSYKYKSIMIIASGIETENFNKALDIIKDQIQELKDGEFTDDDIEQSKNSLITTIRSMTDNNYSMSEFYLSQALTKDTSHISDMIEKINKVSKDEIIEAANKLSLDTIYFLRKKNN